MSKDKGEVLPKTEIMKKVPGSDLPEHLRSQFGHQEGMEDVEQSDLLLPRLGLCQALSPQRRSSDKLFIPGLQEGQLFNTVTNEIYGAELEIVMLFFFKNRIKFFDIDEGGGIDCTSPNGIDGGRISPQGCASCKFSAWGNGETDDEHGNDAPLCTMYHNYMAFTTKGMAPTPLAISYKATGIKISKQLLANIRITNLPMYAKKYTVKVVTMIDGKNQWFEKKLEPGPLLDKETFEEMASLFRSLKSMNFKIDDRGEEGDTSFNEDDMGSTTL